VGPDLEVLPVDDEPLAAPPRHRWSGWLVPLVLAALLVAAAGMAVERQARVREATSELQAVRRSLSAAQRDRDALEARVKSLESVAAALRNATTTTSTPTLTFGALRVDGDPIRGTTVKVVASGLPPLEEVALVVSTIDGYGKVEVAAATTDPAGAAEFTMMVPQFLAHTGPCRTEAACDYVRVEAESHVLTAETRRLRQVVGQAELRVVPAKRGVAYPALSSGECGPQNVEFDGTTWLVDDPSSFVPPNGTTLVQGELTILGRRTARFTSDAGRTGSLHAADSPVFC
jgi:hypothetical protein